MQSLILAFALTAVTEAASVLSLTPAQIRDLLGSYGKEEKIELLADMKKQAVVPKMTDAQIDALYHGAGPDVLLEATSRWLEQNPTYEFVMRKQERVRGALNEVPDRMRVRFREHPRAVYAGWVEGGRHVGQEILYDQRKDPKSIRAHAGGWLNILTVTLALDSAIVKRETNHTLDEMGFLRIVQGLREDQAKLMKAGVSIEPVSSRSVVHEGTRYWESVYVTPGPPQFYAAKARLLFDLETGVPRLLEIWNKQGELLERIFFESVRWVKLDDAHFDEGNPEYAF